MLSYVAPSAINYASGSCFSNSAAATRDDAYRCSAGTQTYDPCFTSPGNKLAVICVPNPLDAPSIIQLNLGAPIAVPAFVPVEKHPWFIQLADGTVCNFFTGATGGIGGERINYGCSDGWVILGEPTISAAWAVHEVRLAPRSVVVQASARALVRTAWE